MYNEYILLTIAVGLFSRMRKAGGAELLTQADSLIMALTEEKSALEKRKQEKLQRQVELWSVMAPSPELEAEYRKVSAEIAYMIKKLLCLDQYLEKLQLERHHCKDGTCDAVGQLIATPQPCENITLDLTPVNY